MAVTFLRLEDFSRFLGAGIGAVCWLCGLWLLAKRGHVWIYALLLLCAAAWAVAGNYRAFVSDLCDRSTLVQDVPRMLIGLPPILTFQEPEEGPVDAYRPDKLPVRVPAGSVACAQSEGRHIAVYRIAAPPLMANAPLLRTWEPYVEGVANIFQGWQPDEPYRVVWLCGEGAPRSLFERLAERVAREKGRRAQDIVALPTEPGTTRYQALLVP
jgi:hypothetical protein